ncbi:hypothetical protein [Streptomyces afghaniensis]|uniref:hypothetical protein n=1 Tax=Streptomyces afghaniensis TaxID=66865 RepID=UPI00277EEF4E|nr:hypothetical protein [Streptomyces afghaniensis]MDQ1016672.1 hypothetical protein [Streptomyces afghaniensis]
MTTAVEIDLTDDAVLSTLRDVVAERPEYVYSSPEYMGSTDESGSCFYVHKDEDGANVGAGCAVGVVLHRLGMSLGDLEQHEGEAAWTLLNKIGPKLSERTKNRLNDMQAYQDEGKAWGLAYAQATGETI